MANIYTEEVADRIIKYWEPVAIGLNLLIAGEIIPITGLYKESVHKGFIIMVSTGTPNTGTLEKVLYDAMLLREIEDFDWNSGKPKQKQK